ncbi:MAG: hypothetical protein Q8M94_07050, partial [Ignavibacteria bacterium]|nr:hypothetical protein [Ignavibacteria bacterium]
MLRISSILFSIIILLSFWGCDKKIDKFEPGLNESLGFNQTEYKVFLKDAFTYSDTTNILFQSIKENLDTLKYFYSTK